MPSSSHTGWQSTSAAAAYTSVNLNSTVREARVVPTFACEPLDVISMGTKLALVASSARKTKILYTEHVEIGQVLRPVLFFPGGGYGDIDPKLPIPVCKESSNMGVTGNTVNSGFVGSRPSLALGAFDSSTASLPFSTPPGKLRDGSKTNNSNT